MEEDKRYHVCRDRNIVAAYERFLGRDSGAQLAAFGVHVGNGLGRVLGWLQALRQRRLSASQMPPATRQGR